MRRMRTAVVAAMAVALVAFSLSPVNAVGTGSPVIESPLPGAAHYRGFNGPFVVNFEDAPQGVYEYFVDQVPGAGGDPVRVTPKQRFDFDGPITRPELTVAALAPGAGYTFRLTRDGVEQVSLGFVVSGGAPPMCSIVLPSAVRMKARSQLVKARLSSQCHALNTTYAAWEARHRVGGFAQTFIFNRTSTDSWRIYDDERTGLYTVTPNSAKNSSHETVPQNSTRTVMRMDSRINLTGKRVGSFVTLRTKSTRYSASANRYQAWSKRKVVLAYRNCGSCAWKRLKVRSTDRRGVTNYRFRASRTRQYRAMSAGTATTWAPRPDYLRR